MECTPDGLALYCYTRQFSLQLVSQFSRETSCSNRPLSLGGHVESQENKKLCFCTASLALNSRLGEACRAKTKLVFSSDSTWPPRDKGLSLPGVTSPEMSMSHE